MATERVRCSTVSLALEEAQFGTASTVTSWVLLEQAGAWGSDALPQSGIPARVARALERRVDSLGIRLILIRRPGRSSPRGSHCFFAHTGPEVRLLEHAHLPRGPEQLLDLDLAPLAAGGTVGVGTVEDAPLYLVCTNGSRDPCCAERGRPVAAALQATFGERAWECSHIGGDRFAANLICFPDGVYFGRLQPDQGVEIARKYEAGELDLDHFRGRSCYDVGVQAAEYFARRAEDLHALGGLRLVRRRSTEDVLEVLFATSRNRPIRVVMRVGRGDPRALTCHSTAALRPAAFELLEVG